MLTSTQPTYEAVTCPRCRKTLPPSSRRSGHVVCPSCHRDFEMIVFTPPERRLRAQQIGEAGPDANAVCINHARNIAAHGCGRCGSFVCALCAIEADGQIYCPACYDRLSAEGALTATRTRFRDMGGMATTAAAAGCLLYFLCILFGPFAIYYGIKALKQRKEYGDIESPWRIWLAMFIGAVETVGGFAFIGFLIYGLSK